MKICDKCGEPKDTGYPYRQKYQKRNLWLCDDCYEQAIRQGFRPDRPVGNTQQHLNDSKRKQ